MRVTAGLSPSTGAIGSARAPGYSPVISTAACRGLALGTSATSATAPRDRSHPIRAARRVTSAPSIRRARRSSRRLPRSSPATSSRASVTARTVSEARAAIRSTSSRSTSTTGSPLGSTESASAEPMRSSPAMTGTSHATPSIVGRRPSEGSTLRLIPRAAPRVDRGRWTPPTRPRARAPGSRWRRGRPPPRPPAPRLLRARRPPGVRRASGPEGRAWLRPLRKKRPGQSLPRAFFSCFLGGHPRFRMGLEDVVALLASPDADCLLDGDHKDLPVTDITGPRVLEDRLDDERTCPCPRRLPRSSASA